MSVRKNFWQALFGFVLFSHGLDSALAQCCFVDGICSEQVPLYCEYADGTSVPGECSSCDELLYIVHKEGLFGQTRPNSGFIDPRAESTNGVDINLGMNEFLIRFNQPVVPCNAGDELVDAFVVTHTDVGADPPIIQSAEYVDGDLSYVQIDLDRNIALAKWTTIRAAGVCTMDGQPIVNLGALGDDDEPDRVDISFVPCEVDQNDPVSTFDLLRFRQIAYGTVEVPEERIIDLTDLNRDGVLSPFDLLRFRQLIQGEPPATQSWIAMGPGPRP